MADQQIPPADAALADAVRWAREQSAFCARTAEIHDHKCRNESAAPYRREAEHFRRLADAAEGALTRPPAPLSKDVGHLTFAAFRNANITRCVKWHPEGIEAWSPSDWLTAVTGELGELASLLKMRNRERDGLPGNKFSPTQKQIADEIADVLTYLDLLAAVLNVDLGSAAVEKFNEVSERVGFSDRIEGGRQPAGSVVTAAMRLAGAAVLYRPHEYRLPEDAAEAVYRAMTAALHAAGLLEEGA